MRFPRRRAGLTLQATDGGYVLEDPARDQVHFLNPTAVVIWEWCDGLTPEAAIARELAKAYALTAVPETLVPEALAQMEASGLIEWVTQEEVNQHVTAHR